MFPALQLLGQKFKMPYSFYCSTIALLSYVLCRIAYLIYHHTVWWREGRVCGSGEVEDVGHFVLPCEYVAEERERMGRLVGEKEEGWYEMESNEKVVMMMD